MLWDKKSFCVLSFSVFQNFFGGLFLSISFCKPVFACLPAFSSNISGKSENSSINLIISCVLKFGEKKTSKRTATHMLNCTTWFLCEGSVWRRQTAEERHVFRFCRHSSGTRQDVKWNCEHSPKAVVLTYRIGYQRRCSFA